MKQRAARKDTHTNYDCTGCAQATKRKRPTRLKHTNGLQANASPDKNKHTAHTNLIQITLTPTRFRHTAQRNPHPWTQWLRFRLKARWAVHATRHGQSFWDQQATNSTNRKLQVQTPNAAGRTPEQATTTNAATSSTGATDAAMLMVDHCQCPSANLAEPATGTAISSSEETRSLIVTIITEPLP